jgi:hypothetical protein
VCVIKKKPLSFAVAQPVEMLLYRSCLALLLCVASVRALGWGKGDGAAKQTPPPKQPEGKQGADAAVKSSGGQPGKIGSFLKKALGPEIEIAQRKCGLCSQLHIERPWSCTVEATIKAACALTDTSPAVVAVSISHVISAKAASTSMPYAFQIFV